MHSCQLYILIIGLVFCLIIGCHQQINASPIEELSGVTPTTTTTTAESKSKEDKPKKNPVFPPHLRMGPLMPFAFPFNELYPKIR